MFFWEMTIVLISIACLFVCYPWFDNKYLNEIKQSELNRIIYLNRQEEIIVEKKEGLHSSERHVQLELQRALLDDIPVKSFANKQRIQGKISIIVVMISLFFLIGGSYLVYKITGRIDDVNRWKLVVNNLPSLSQKLSLSQSGTLSQEDTQALILGLRTRLFEHPNDATGWLLLGKLALSQRKGIMAEKALEKAFQIHPERSEIKLAYAQILLLSEQKDFEQRGVFLLKSLVLSHQKQKMAYTFLFLHAYQKNRFNDALKYLHNLYQLVDKKTEQSAEIKRQIEQLNNRVNPLSDRR